MSRTLTPLRAIPSNLANRATLSLPSASQTYEPLIKSILRQRLTNRIFVLSVACCWLETTIWTIWGIGGRDAVGLKTLSMVPFHPSTLVVVAMTWLLVAVPVIVIRKTYLTASRTVASSPAKTWRSAQSKNSTSYALMIYSASAIAATVLHVTLAYINEPKAHGDPRLSLFVKSRRYPYYLNGRLLFLVLSQVTLAFSSLLRNVMLDRFAFRWSLSPNQYQLNIFELIRVFVVITLFNSASLLFASLSFAAIRVLFPVLYKFPLLPIILRPFTGHFVRGSLTLLLPFAHIGLLFRAWFIGFTTMFIWEISELLFDVLIPQPINVSQFVANSSIALISGLSSSDRVMKFFALSELKDIAADDSPAANARRSELFADQKYSPSQWSQLCRECLLLLGYDYQLLLRRGIPAPPLPVVPEPKSGPSLPATPTPLLRKDIFRKERSSPIRAVIDSFASDGSLAQAVDEGTQSLHIPEVIKSVESAMLPQLEKSKDDVARSVSGAAGTLTTKFTGGMSEVIEPLLSRYIPAFVRGPAKHWREWWREERLCKIVEACIPFRELDVLAVEVLSHLVCASLSEDRYGVVQRDTPKIIEAMLSFLSAVEEYQIEINSLYTAPSPDANLSPKEVQESEEKRVEVEKANDSLGLVGNALKEGMARVARTFGDKLLAFKFPTKTARKLQGFLDYC